MEPVPTEDQRAPEPIRFRAGKKRKAYRQRCTTAAEDDAAAARAPPSPHDADLGRGREDGAEAQNGHGDDDGDADAEHAQESAVAAALRLRNARRAARLRGVGFRSEGRPGDDSEQQQQQQQQLVLREADGGAEKDGGAAVYGIANRFMHQTGLLTHLDDAHMNAYIESRLASRNAPSGTSANPSAAAITNPDNDDAEEEDTSTAASVAAPDKNKLRDQPTKQGKLVEVDLPSDTRHRIHENNNNNNNNNNKRRRLENPDKPPRRQRNRRNSDDIARDNLVEQFLHENRLDVYDVPSAPEAPSASAPGQDPSADDRLAEQFRQQYLDEQALRRKKKRPVQQLQQQLRQQTGDVLKGPKLGGSRNVRSAVRDILLQQEKEKRGKV